MTYKNSVSGSQQNTVSLIGAAWDLGAPLIGSALGPRTVMAASPGFQHHWDCIEADYPVLRDMALPQDSATLDQLVSLNLRLANTVSRAVTNALPFAVIGGDHSCAIGTWNGVAHALHNKESFGLIWIDAHLDAHTPQTSISRQWHGMPLAVLLGEGEPRLTRLLTNKPALKPEAICIIGARDFELVEQQLLQRLGVRVYFADELLQRGLKTVMHEAIHQVTKKNARFGISIDLDVINPSDAPGVNSPVDGGIEAAALLDAAQELKDHSGFLGVEIAELNVLRDTGGRTVKLVHLLLESIFSQRKEVIYE